MTQDCRRDLIELLFLALYLDNHLSLAEDSVLADALDAIGWESGEPRDIFILNAFAKAREAARSELATDEFLTERADRLKAAGEETMALTWLSKVLGSDGVSPNEERYLKRLQRRWFP